ncbi:MAG: tRNA 2-thiouridine(34) synthase MnmA [Ferrovibrio sp.]|uniref:tRNA 2-thiouridine(34) synthase MnmA n=1 Tax=Ferrovibrio sp. TaxID=1917215 RepID=UPI00262A0966|nr:tRNA 2-thiouridine(34) synthase MnmA [Ferrovibrio sp.]MCW0233770.1 tRNA 2-thiouridine(34) synthase MnmA [Ferrovibrio sp.]
MTAADRTAAPASQGLNSQECNSLGFAKAPAQTRVVVAMSGGVDSSVVAGLLKREGYDVIGITLQLYDHGAAIAKKGACCAGQDIHDARQVAERLGIPHYVLDYESRFRQAVIDEFAESYVNGETPIPCIRCNQRVKFRDLLETARDLAADCLATGHYVQRSVDPATGRAQLLRGADPRRDQSYFLYTTTQDQLDYLRFPLGAMEKPAVRQLAEEFGLIVADKPDSQDICFVPNGDYASVVAKLRPEAAEPGEIVDLQGTVLGRHDGVIHFTVGQRKGLGIAASEPLYVLRLDAAARRVVVGPKQALARRDVLLRELNWLAEPIPADGLEVSVKLRSAQPAVAARLFAAGEGPESHLARLELSHAEFGVAPGQAGVVYAGERLLGGGWIARAEGRADAARTAGLAA